MINHIINSIINSIISDRETRYCVSTLYIEETGSIILDIALVQTTITKWNRKIKDNKIKQKT